MVAICEFKANRVLVGALGTGSVHAIVLCVACTLLSSRGVAAGKRTVVKAGNMPKITPRANRGDTMTEGDWYPPHVARDRGTEDMVVRVRTLFGVIKAASRCELKAEKTSV